MLGLGLPYLEPENIQRKTRSSYPNFAVSLGWYIGADIHISNSEQHEKIIQAIT